MSIHIPLSLGWVANLAVGENWPQGDEDKLRALGGLWEETARDLTEISRELMPSVSGVLENMAGQAMAEFREFIVKFLRNLRQTAKSADQLARLARTTAVELQYAKYMILLQLVWMASEIAQWAVYAPAVVAATVTAGRLAVRMVLRRMLLSIAMGVGLMVGMDVVVQAFQTMMGDRTRWNLRSTRSMAASGAIGGAIGGGLGLAGDALMPKFVNSLVGKFALGGVTGLVTTIAQDAALGGHSSIASAFTSGAAEAFSGNGRRFRWQKPEEAQLNTGMPGISKIDLSELRNNMPPTPSNSGGQITESNGPTRITAGASNTDTNPSLGDPSVTDIDDQASGTQSASGTQGTAAIPGPEPVTGAPGSTVAGRPAGGREGGEGAEPTARQQEGQNERRRTPTEPVVDEPAGGTSTASAGLPGNGPAGPAQGLPGFETTLTRPGGGDGTDTPTTSSSPVAVPTTGAGPGTSGSAAGTARRTGDAGESGIQSVAGQTSEDGSAGSPGLGGREEPGPVPGADRAEEGWPGLPDVLAPFDPARSQREQPQVREPRPGPVGETTGAPLEQAAGTHPATEAVEQPAHGIPQHAASHGGRAGEEAQGGGGLAPDAALRRFAEQRFVTLDEQEARRLWAEAARITAEHNPFPLTFGRSGEGMRERDPGRYWATMRVAQVLHQAGDPSDRIRRAVAEARSLAAVRRVRPDSKGLLGGVADTAGVADRAPVREDRESGPPRADALRTFLRHLDSAGASSSGQHSDVPSGSAAAGRADAAPVSDLVRDEFASLGAGPGLRTLYGDAAYAPKAREFEKRLGAYAFSHPRARETARQGVERLWDVLARAHPDLSDEDVAAAFFTSDVTSAGQVGADTGMAGLMGLLRQGNVRELMTAFLNAAFFSTAIRDGTPPTLKALLHEIADSGDWAKAEHLGLDVRALRYQAAYLRSDLRTRLHDAVRRVAPGKEEMFEKDFFALGNVAAQAPSWQREAAKYWGDLRYRHRWPRPEAERLHGENAATPGEWARRGVPLSWREEAFLAANQGPLPVLGFRTEPVPLEQVRFDEQGAPLLDGLRSAPGVLGVEVHYDMPEGAPGRTVTGIITIIEEPGVVEQPRAGDLLLAGEQGPELPLSSVSGKARFALDEASALFRELHDKRGMPLITGVSGTAARVGNAFKLLHVPDLDGEGLALALIGWMLPLQDHSLYESLAGLQTANVVPSLERIPLDDAAGMYRSVPGIPLAELRQQVGENGMLPHEALYWSKVTGAGFAEPGPTMVLLAEGRMQQFSRLVGASDQRKRHLNNVERWLRDNGLSAEEVLERLSAAHFTALMAYTGTASALMNTVLKAGPAELRPALRSRVRRMIDEHSDTAVSPILTSDPVMRELFAVDPGELTPERKAQHTKDLYAAAEKLLPAIEREMAVHSAMLLEALERLPPATGVVWRGKRSAEELFAGTVRSDPSAPGASEFSFPAFTSFSRAGAKAMEFMWSSPLPGVTPVLVRAELSGYWGRDISAFSQDVLEKEVLLLPGARLRIGTREVDEDSDGEYEVIEAREVVPRL